MIIKRRLAQTIRTHWYADSFPRLAGPKSVGKSFLARRIFAWSNPDPNPPADPDPTEDGAAPQGRPEPTALLDRQFNLFTHDGIHLGLEKDWPVLTKSRKPYVQLPPNPGPGGTRYTLLPVTLSEFGTIPRNTYDFMRFLTRGGYPGGLDSRYRPGDFYNDLLAEWYLEIRGTWVRPSLMDTFREFMEHCALQTGSILNCSKLARGLGVSPPLVRRWVEILVRDHLAHLLPAYPEGYGRRQLTTAKLYFWDTGVMRAAMKSSERGAGRFDRELEALLEETWLVAEIRKTLIHEGIQGGVYYWQDRRGLHVPIILHAGPSRVAITPSRGRRSRDSPTLKAWQRMAGPEWQLVRAFTDANFTDRRGVHHVPWFAVPEKLIKPIAPINTAPVSDWASAYDEPRFATLPMGASMAPHFFGKSRSRLPDAPPGSHQSRAPRSV